MTTHNRLPVLEIFRGVAAIFVVIHHALISIEYYHHFSNSYLKFICHIGKYGVDFFFVLSGFIISYSYAQSRYNGFTGFKRFLKLRLIRIYTPFLPISIGLFLMYSLFSSFSNSDKEIDFLTSITLIPLGKPALSVAWTLSHEMLFYLIFSTVFIFPKIWKEIILIWTTCILINYFLQPSIESSIYPIILSPYNLEFVMGCLLSNLYYRGVKVSVNLLLPLAIVLFFGFTFIIWNAFYEISFLSNFIFTLFSSVLIWLCLDINVKPRDSFLFLGTISYSIYLIHNPLQMLIVRFYPKVQTELSFLFLVFLILFFVILTSWFYYNIFEKSVSNYLRRIWIY